MMGEQVARALIRRPLTQTRARKAARHLTSPELFEAFRLALPPSRRAALAEAVRRYCAWV